MKIEENNQNQNQNIETGANTDNNISNSDNHGENNAQGASDPVKEKKYTDEDVDRIVAKKIAAERKRAAKALAIDTQESDLDIRERNVAKREMLMDVKERLNADGLPASLANLVSYENRETFEQSYKDVITSFNECVSIGIKNALKGNIPKTGNTGGGDPLKQAFARKR